MTLCPPDFMTYSAHFGPHNHFLRNSEWTGLLYYPAMLNFYNFSFLISKKTRDKHNLLRVMKFVV